MIRLAVLFFLASKMLPAAIITIDAGFPFNPRSVTVTAGDTIRWQFLSGHNVAETNDPLPGAATYNGTGFLSPCCGASTFDWISTVGNHLYFCQAHGGVSMYGHIHVLAPTATATPSLTESPSSTETPTESPTFTISETFTLGPSPSFSATQSASPTQTLSPSVTPTPSFSPTPSASPSRSVTYTKTPSFRRSPIERVILGPVPVKAGNPLCLAFPAAPFKTRCELYNSRGELVIREKFDTQASACVETKTLAPGLYFAYIEEEDQDQKHKARRQKIVVLP